MDNTEAAIRFGSIGLTVEPPSMSRVKKRTFSVAERVASWRAWDKKCAYTGEPIAFRDLEIDHVIPEEMLYRPDEIQALRGRLNLANDFDLNSFGIGYPRCITRTGKRLRDSSRTLLFSTTWNWRVRNTRTCVASTIAFNVRDGPRST
ncbi:MAG: HNH endonuclease [Vicinamibacterales bacterium]